ncbi:MAG: hypothetical protein KJ063_15140 [Anaerolineae bacterium]|nr:hypothetical protein [Anaerolineae bacterium]
MKDKLQGYGLIVAFLVVALLMPLLASSLPSLLAGGGGGRSQVTVPRPRETEVITIEIDKLLLGEELIKIGFLADLNQRGLTISAPLLMLILAGVFVGGIAVVGGGLAFTYKFLDNFVLNTKQNSEFKTSAANLEKKQKEQLKLINKANPPDPIPSHETPRWSAAATSIIAILFAWVMGLMFADVFFPSGDVVIRGQLVAGSTILSWIFIILTVIILAFVYRPQEFIAHSEATANKSTDWGLIWVIVAGALILGVGLGLMFAVRAAGG